MSTYAMRQARRERRAARERKERIDLAIAIVTLFLMLVAFGIAGTFDYEDEQRQLAFWAERGVVLQEW